MPDLTTLTAAAEEVLRATDALTDACNGLGHPGEAHDDVLRMGGPIASQVWGDCAGCGGAQYDAEDDLHRAIGALRLALGQEPKPWERSV